MKPVAPANSPPPATAPAADAPGSPWSERVGTWGFLIFLAVFGAVMAPRMSNIAGGADPSCYLELSRRLLRGDLITEMRPVAGLPLEALPPRAYAPLSCEPLPDYGGLKPNAFPGLPLWFAGFDLFLPTGLAVIVGLLLCLLAAGGFLFLLLRELKVGAAWAAAGAFAVGVSPVTILIGSNPITDVPTCALTSLCWWLALKARAGRGWGLGLGFALGCAVLTRQTNALFFAPVLVTLVTGGWRRVPWLSIGLGGLPPAAFLFGYNTLVHGGPFSSAYTTDSNVWGMFSFATLSANLRFYAGTINGLVLPGLIWLAPLVLLLGRRRAGLAATVWVWLLVFLGFYGCYSESGRHWWELRYLFPAIVAAVVGSVVVLQATELRLTRPARLRPFRGALALLVAGAALTYGIDRGRELGAYRFRQNEQNILEVKDWINAHTAPDDVFLCLNFSGALHYYTDRPLVRHETLEPATWRTLTAAVGDGAAHRLYGVFYIFEYADPAAVAAAFPGDWEPVFQSRDGVLRVFRLNSPPAGR